MLRANVTCAAFEVDSSALAATYIAEADAFMVGVEWGITSQRS